MKYDSIIFDMDGTLWDSREGVVLSWNEILEREGQPYRTSLEQMTFCMGKPMNEIAEIVIPDKPYSETAELFEKCFTYENEYLARHGAILYPKLCETLAELKKHYRLFIVSNCQSGYIEAMFASHPLAQYFEDIECYGNTGLLKADNIRLLADRNRLKAPVYVGDVQGDADAAHAAGVDFIWAAYGFGKVTNPEAVIHSPEELKKVL